MSGAVVYRQVSDGGAGTPLYETSEAGSVGWAGYLVMNTGIALPEEIEASDALNGKYDGAYLFYRTRPEALDTDPAGFAQQAAQYIKSNAGENRALLWLASGSAPYFGTFSEFGFQFVQNTSNQWQISTNLNAFLGTNLILNVQASLIITVDAGTAELTFSYKGSQNALISLQVGQAEILKASPVSARVAASGTSTGCVVFQAAMNPGVVLAAPPKGLPQGVQYATSDERLFFPAFDTAAWPASIPVVATADPSDPLNNGIPQSDLQNGCLRTALMLAGAPSLASYYLTPQGNAIALTPLGTAADAQTVSPGAGALAVASADEASTPIGDATVYLAPAGNFGVSGAGTGDGEPVSLMGGLSGSEQVNLTSYSAESNNDTLCFVPSQPAFAKVFPFQAASLQQTDSGSLEAKLTAEYQTSWATVLTSSGDDVVYQAEPEGNALYAMQAGSDAGAAPILLSTPPRMPLNGSTQNTFPLAPYANTPTGDGPETLEQFESQILAPVRKQVIQESSAPIQAKRAHARARGLSAQEQQYSTSPQGFLVASDPETGAYLNVQLAQSTDDGEEVPFASPRRHRNWRTRSRPINCSWLW